MHSDRIIKVGAIDINDPGDISDDQVTDMIIKKNDRTCIRVCNLHDRDADRDIADTTASERMGMMWQLALDAWAFKGETVAESGFQRHAVSIQRRKS